MCRGGMCTDNDDADTDAGRRQRRGRTKHDCKGSLVDKPNEPKKSRNLDPRQGVY